MRQVFKAFKSAPLCFQLIFGFSVAVFHMFLIFLFGFDWIYDCVLKEVSILVSYMHTLHIQINDTCYYYFSMCLLEKSDRVLPSHVKVPKSPWHLQPAPITAHPVCTAEDL